MKKRIPSLKDPSPKPAAGAGKPRPGPDQSGDERKLLSALAPLKAALDAFGEETEKVLAGLDIPNTAYFAGIVRKGRAAAKKAAFVETLAFTGTAITFLAGILWFLQAGYIIPVAVFYGIATLFLPTVLLFVPEVRREEVSKG